MPVADLVPHRQERSPWVSSVTLRTTLEEAAADATLLDDLADARGALLDDA
jgi:antitoxin (DNA-binding transcriptional repressor) of toxin-antitoxin stability system